MAGAMTFSLIGKESTTMEKSADPKVLMKTSLGTIELELFPDKAPLAVKNFLDLIKKSYYDGVIFHRVIKGFMIQGGDPTGTGRGGKAASGSSFKDEFSPDLKFDKSGLLAMANAGPNTNGSQFFITTVATPHLNNRHTIFGKVTSGMDVVKKIETTPVDGQDRPKTPVKIESITIESS
jgi:peptidylprolyl isomerase